jgi:predicted metalloprotease with PDZ domain
MRPVIESGSRDYYYDYEIGINYGADTTLHVSLKMPVGIPACDSFCFPVVIPGSYQKAKYGKYISGFRAYTSDGDTISCKKLDSSIYRFDSPQQVQKVEYIVNQTFKYKNDSIAVFAGTKFGSSHCILNLYAICGFFPQLTEKPIRIRILRPEVWKIGTALEMDSIGYLYAATYHQLMDNPIIAGNLSQYAFEFNSTTYFVYVYSDTSGFSARGMRKIVKNAAIDADLFMNKSSFSSYSFLFNFLKDSLLSFGAHEHSNSSMYVNPVKNIRNVKENLNWIIRHELFHTLTPLGLKGRDIDDKEYLCVSQVTNLWFYEGLAQWAAFKMQLMNGTIALEEYLKVLSNCLSELEFGKDTLSLIQLSQGVYQNRSFISDIYLRGIITGTLLDMEIILKTNGKRTLREILLELRDEYPPGKPFATDSLIEIIASKTYTDVGTFLHKILYSNEMPDLKELFDRFGVMYTDRENHSFIRSDFGLELRPDSKNERFIIHGIYNEADLYSFQKGDTLLTINGYRMSPMQFVPEVRNLFTSDPGLGYVAVLKGTDGKERTVNARTVRYYMRNQFNIIFEDSDMYRAWVER